MKRIFLFVATNIAIMITLSIVLSLLGVHGLPHRRPASTTRR